MTTTFSGVIPPVITPLTDSGELDLDSLESLVNHLIDGGVNGLFVLGSSGEVAFLTDADRQRVVATAVRVAAGRVPVLAGVNETSTRRVIEQVRLVESGGADAIVATAPFYVLPNADEIDQHFRLVAASTDLPLFAYDVPVRVRTKLDIAMLVRLGTEGVIVGVKDSSGDDVGFRRLVLANRAAGSPLSLLTGHEVVADGALLAGAVGVVPGLGNVDPHGYAQLVAAAHRGDWAEAKRMQDRLTELFEIVFQASGVSGEAGGVGAFKEALAHQGVIASGRMSPPIPRLEADVVSRITAIVDASQSDDSSIDAVRINDGV
ncbi:dihydrodipicolinate synthase family protein [Paramicrobacterium chengjingii]|uniref:dihydrodipicolinate synthase family protein n=1 Tax=Paramicrobacterium chengjingii TaxID=2769067 RepID=UPI001421E580|nr:dihydrodipicolinate synthase family protein [Microbacterium chengjingii]